MTVRPALLALLLAGCCAGSGFALAALTDEEIRRQIDEALERGRAQQAPARPPATQPSPSAPPPGEPVFRDDGFTPAVRTHAGFTAFHFPGELGNAQTYEVTVTGDDVWIGTSIGLVRHDTRKGRWSLIRLPKQTGAEGVPSVVAAGNRLAVQLWHYPKPGHARAKGAWWYDPATGRWERLGSSDYFVPLAWDGSRLWGRIGDTIHRYDPATRQHQEFSSKQQPLLRHAGVKDLVVSGYETWLCTTGKHNPKTRKFEGGGILMLHTQTGAWRHYRAPHDGPAHDYCAAIAADAGSVWVAHWDNKKGLSRYDRKGYRWEHLPIADNQTAIGGVKLAVDGDRMWIGQQNGITWLDLRTRNAFSFKEAMGLPGYITSGFARSPDALWAGMYAYGGKNYHGVRSSGLVRLDRNPAPPIPKK